MESQSEHYEDRLGAIEHRLQELAVEFQSLEKELAALRALTTQTQQLPRIERAAKLTTCHNGSAPEEKVRLFLQRFQGRRDVFATAWVSKDKSKKGWSPQTVSGFYNGTGSNKYRPLTDAVVERHLSGLRHPLNTSETPFHIGLYPMLENDTCALLVCDFDDGNWKNNAGAFVNACRQNGVKCLAEISRSGSGAHVWIFLEEQMPAAIVRRAGAQLLHEAMDVDSGIDFDSYDRFFPAQDTLPRHANGRGQLGNLIALPLQGDYRRTETTLFVDPSTWEPCEDQWRALAEVGDNSSALIQKVAQNRPTTELTPSRATKEQIKSILKNISTSVHESHDLTIDIEGLPPAAVNYLKHSASLSNPEFYRRQAQRFSTFGIPRLITRFQTEGSQLHLPRGLKKQIKELIPHCVETDSFPKRKRRLKANFRGRLAEDQQVAVQAMVANPHGLLVAPPGFGKTVVACAILAKIGRPTAILVNRKELQLQWINRIENFVDSEFPVGRMGGGPNKLSGKIDVIMMQSISRKGSDPSILEKYGLVIVDECHNAASPAIEAALASVAVENWIGLTATPFRSDQLGELVTLLLGPIIVDMRPQEQANNSLKSYFIHKTKFHTDTDPSKSGGIQEIYNELAMCESRNQQIATDILKALKNGRICLVLSNRVEHVKKMAESLSTMLDDAIPILQIHGKLDPKDRRHTIERARQLAESESPFALVAMDAIVGEGFDLVGLDTLFLAMPVSFKGKIIQQIGRVTRGDQQKRDIQVHDYLDTEVPQLDRMQRRRKRVISQEGFTLSESREG